MNQRVNKDPRAGTPLAEENLRTLGLYPLNLDQIADLSEREISERARLYAEAVATEQRNRFQIALSQRSFGKFEAERLVEIRAVVEAARAERQRLLDKRVAQDEKMSRINAPFTEAMRRLKEISQSNGDNMHAIEAFSAEMARNKLINRGPWWFARRAGNDFTKKISQELAEALNKARKEAFIKNIKRANSIVRLYQMGDSYSQIKMLKKAEVEWNDDEEAIKNGWYKLAPEKELDQGAFIMAYEIASAFNEKRALFIQEGQGNKPRKKPGPKKNSKTPES